VGAVDIASDDKAGAWVKNVTFKNIDITDSRNDAIYIHKKSGEGFSNLKFENITINGTGREFPLNNALNRNWGRGYGILFVGYPSGDGIYCDINYSNRGGNALTNVNSEQIGNFSWISSCLTTSLENPFNASDIVHLYPNPFIHSSNLLIRSDEVENYFVVIKDISGRYVSSKSVAGDGVHTIGEDLPTGIFILEVFDGNTLHRLNLLKL
ncbi:MAG TPA: T9SS type A sorting domain-containing protein, partial [Cytophagaceae bacterium]